MEGHLDWSAFREDADLQESLVRSRSLRGRNAVWNVCVCIQRYVHLPEQARDLCQRKPVTCVAGFDSVES